jgi:hypothetical protein
VGFTLAVVADDRGQIGLTLTGGIGSYGGIGASATAGAQVTTAAAIQDLRGAGAATSVTVNAGPVVGPVGEVGYFVGRGYQGGSTAIGLGVGTPVSLTGFLTGTAVVCLFNCIDTNAASAPAPPSPPAVPASSGPRPTGSCGRKC